MNNSANRLTIKDLPAEMVELSDEALSQVCGGINVNLSQFIFNGMLKLGGGGGGRELIPFQHSNSIDAPGPQDNGSFPA